MSVVKSKDLLTTEIHPNPLFLCAAIQPISFDHLSICHRRQRIMLTGFSFYTQKRQRIQWAYLLFCAFAIEARGQRSTANCSATGDAFNWVIPT